MPKFRVGVLWLSAFATGCSLLETAPLEAPVVNLRSLEPVALGLNSQVFSATLNLYNPNGVPLTVSRGEIELEALLGRRVEVVTENGLREPIRSAALQESVRV